MDVVHRVELVRVRLWQVLDASEVRWVQPGVVIMGWRRTTRPDSIAAAVDARLNVYRARLVAMSGIIKVSDVMR